MIFKCKKCNKIKVVTEWRSSVPVICDDCGEEMEYIRDPDQGYPNVPKAKLQDGKPVR
jgi:transcription elongation factor Elf1